MCGLVGVAGDLTFKEIDAFKDLLYISAFRGMDSTGVSVVTWHHNDQPYKSTTVRALGSPAYLLDSRHFDKALSQTNKKILMGHCRAATRGDIRIDNAHPFEFSKIVAAHNGTLDYSSQRDLPFHNFFGTDSEALISAINDSGTEEIIPKMEGAWALSLVDKDAKTISLFRNKERDLCFCFSEDRKCLYWASEYAFLKFVFERRGLKSEGDKVYRVSEDVQSTWKIPDRMVKFSDSTRKTIKGKEHVAYVNNNTWRGNQANNSPFQAARRVVQANGNEQRSKEQTNVVRLFTKYGLDTEADTCLSDLPKFHADFYERKGKKHRKIWVYTGWSGRPWSEQMFKQFTKNGCAFCGEVPEFGTAVVFCRQDAFTCQKCTGDQGIEEAVRLGIPGVAAQSASENTELNDPLPTIN